MVKLPEESIEETSQNGGPIRSQEQEQQQRCLLT